MILQHIFYPTWLFGRSQ